ncbi:MAG: hypothetical protein KDC10_04015 [Calditrichaeota bacterium]|nr:hypothetical protein [Candidatus Cloacimonadota bacterium]MCB1046346.1 hypothetical protein [Calditrichota bacterium]MCB9473389.1 hypothetical protein [Candidatus Delongbacteria bacterium]
MLRLIDVVLIVLFAVMMITSINDQFEVRLVQTSNMLPMPEDARGFIMVGLGENSSFLFKFGREVYGRADREKMLEEILAEKEAILQHNREQTGQQASMEPQVRIWADSLARCEDIKLLVDICRQAEIACGLLTVKQREKGTN